MTAAASVLAKLESAGIRLRLEAGQIVASPKSAVTNELRGLVRAHKAELLDFLAKNELPDPKAEARRQRVLALLDAALGVKYAIFADDDTTDPVIVAVAIRGIGTCEIEIPKARYDGAKILELVERKRPELTVIDGGKS